jgi:hypothetical protein
VADRKPVAPDLRSGPLGYELNGADNGSDAAKVRALVLFWEHRWELESALDCLEQLKIQLGLFDLPTRKAAELIPTMVREIQEGTVNGRLLRRAIEAERKLNAKEAK